MAVTRTLPGQNLPAVDNVGLPVVRSDFRCSPLERTLSPPFALRRMDTPLISVVVAVFNARATLQQCVDGFASQTYANKELVVIDGGSTDGTVEILRRNQETFAYWISEPDRGIYSAWNKALRQCRGDWICFLGADDYFWDDQVLAHLVPRLVELPPQLRVAYGSIMIVSASGEDVHPFGGPWPQVRTRFRQLMSIPHQATMHRRSLFDRHGMFDESFRIAGDHELLLRELKSADACFLPDIVVAAMRQGGGISTTPSNAWTVLFETRRAQRLNGIRWPGVLWMAAIGRLCLRWILWSTLGERRTRRALDVGRRLMGLPPFWTRT